MTNYKLKQSYFWNFGSWLG